MSNTKKLFESFQNNLAEIEKNIKTIIVKLSDSRQAEIEVEDGNHIRKIWYTNNNGSTGFNYDEKSDKFINFNNPNGNFLTDREDKTIKDKIHEILNNKMNEDENIDGQISFDDLERAKNPIFKYYTKFNLTSPVNDFEEAQAYLTEDDMTQYLLEDNRIPQSGRDKVKSVTWDLEDDDRGTIWVITNAELTEEESSAISDWISGQNSDGLGEGFEQQSFAESYYNPETGEGPFTCNEAEEEIEEEIERLVEEQYEDYLDVDIDEATDEDIERAQEECRDDLSSPGSMYDIDDWYTMSSFDWQYNKYKLTLKDMNESVEYKNNLNEVVKDESLDNDFLEYLLSETEINRRGEISYLPDFEDAENYKDLTEEEYNKSIKYLEDLINNAKFYYSDGELFIELNDNHTFWDIDNDEIGDIYIGDYLEPYFDAFEEDTGVELWQSGRSGRHIVVKLNLENLERYDELKLEQERQEKAFIEEMNNLGKEDDLDESNLNETSLIDFTNGFNFNSFAYYIENKIKNIYPSAKFKRRDGYCLEVYLGNNDTSRFIIEAFINTKDDGSLNNGAIEVTYPFSIHYSNEDINTISNNWTGNSNVAHFSMDKVDEAFEMIKFVCDHYEKSNLDESVSSNIKKNYKETLEKELEKVQDSIANSDPKKDISGLESKRDFLMDKLNQLDESEIDRIELSPDEEQTYNDIMNKDYDLEFDYLDDDEQKEYLEVAKSIRQLGPEEAFIDVFDEVKEKAKKNHLETDLLTYVYLNLNKLDESTLNKESSLEDVRKDSKEKGLLSEENIYKIETKDSGAPKIELVKVLSDNGKIVKVKSIYDDYEFEYNKDYFDNNKQIASEEDIKNYKFKINESTLTESYNPLSTELYMNTWGNYNINGADVEKINGGWMDIDKAKEFLEAHKDEEPFINDTNDCPISVSEYDNPWEVIEHLEKIEELDNIDSFLAILEEHNDNFDEALDIYESGDFTFFPGVDNDEDLGIAWVNMVGGLEGVTNIENYIDEDAYRESWREAAESSVREDNPDIDEDSDEFEDLVEEWLDNVVDEQLQIDIDEGNDLSDYFDYEAFGRELNFGGFYYASTGAIETY